VQSRTPYSPVAAQAEEAFRRAVTHAVLACGVALRASRRAPIEVTRVGLLASSKINELGLLLTGALVTTPPSSLLLLRKVHPSWQ